MLTAEYVSPCGKLLIGSHKGSILLCDWIRDGRIETTLRRISKYLPEKMSIKEVNLSGDTMDSQPDNESFLLAEAARQLDEYFAGLRVAFVLPLRLLGTDFQKRVWRELLTIPYGETIAYREVAKRAEKPSGVRAVASAIGANPLSILIPCHRVIASSGNISGYAGGLDAKRYLLSLESHLLHNYAPGQVKPIEHKF